MAENDEAPLDLSRLQAIAPNNVEFHERLLDLYLGESRKRLQALGRAVAEDDLEGIRREAHAIKGSAGNVGARRVAEAAARLRAAADGGEGAACRSCWADLRSEMEAADGWIRDHLGHTGR